MLAKFIRIGAGNKMAYWIKSVPQTQPPTWRGIAVDSNDNLGIAIGGYGSGGGGFLKLSSADGSLLGGMDVYISNNSNYAQNIKFDSTDRVLLQLLQQGVLRSDLQTPVVYNFGVTTISGGTAGSIYHINVDSSDNIYRIGTARIPSGAVNCVVISKANSANTSQWDKYFYIDSTKACSPSAVAIDGSGDVYGYALGTTSDSKIHAVVVKFNSSGVFQWSRKLTAPTGDISGPQYGICGSMDCDSSGNVYVSGWYSGNSRLFLAKYNSSGVLQWQKYRSETRAYNYTSRVHVNGNDIYLTAPSADFNYTTKFDPNGNVQFSRYFSVSGYSSGNAANASQGAWTDLVTSKDGSCFYVKISQQPQTFGSPRNTIYKLPSDGTLTGTYGNIMYVATTLTYSTADMTDSDASVTTGSAQYSASSGPSLAVMTGDITL